MTDPIASFSVDGVHVPLSGANQQRGQHWAAQKRANDPWRTFGIIAGRRLTHEGFRPPKPVQIRLVLPVPDRRRRDPHNYVGTVVKAFVDGLVIGGLLRDDAPAYVQVLEPELRTGTLLRAEFFPG